MTDHTHDRHDADATGADATGADATEADATEADATGADKDSQQQKALEDTFPASDPPASTGTTGPTGDRPPG